MNSRNENQDIGTPKELVKYYEEQKKKIDKSLEKWNWILCIFTGIFIVGTVCFWYRFNEKFDYMSVFGYFPFWILIGFFIFYSIKQITGYKKLYNEYAYKEAVNRTYISYARVVKESDNENLQNKLLEMVFKAAENNFDNALNKEECVDEFGKW